MPSLLGLRLAALGLALIASACTFGTGAPGPDEDVAATSGTIASENGIHLINGLTTNGLTTNGLTTNGLSGNGLSGNGLSGNGLSGNGLSGNGLTTNGLTIHGLAHNELRHLELIASDSAANTWKAVASTSGATFDRLPHLEGQWLAEALRAENGVSVAAALATDSGLASGAGLMASAGGQLVASYLVKCALPPAASIRKSDADGNEHVFRGAIGVAPAWENGACDSECQEWVSACLLAHVNLTGDHVNIWITAEIPAVGWATSPEFSHEEAAFFGNLFAERPEAYVCYGADVAVNPIPGRVCVGARTCPYVDPYLSAGGACSRACSAHSAAPGDVAGYEACRVGQREWSRVLTSWKQ